MPKAIVTGASAGIGAALARRLARERYDLVLVARREDRLRDLARELEGGHGIKVEVLGLDVTSPEAPTTLLERAGDADVLVNNAGAGRHGSTLEIAVPAAAAMVRLNCESVTAITQAFLPRMVERRSGTILNVASIAGFQPTPWFSIYAATKAYVLSLSQSLDAEVRRHGVRVLALCPGPVPTEFQEVAGTTLEHAPSFMVVSPERVADDAVWQIKKGRGVWIPNFVLRGAVAVQRFFPQRLVVYLAGRAVPPPEKPGRIPALESHS